MIFHLTLKNSSENFLEQSEIRGIINLINEIEEIELIGAWQDTLDYSSYIVVKSESYETIFDIIKSNIPNRIVFINPVESIDDAKDQIRTGKKQKHNMDYWKNEFENERQ